MNMNSFTRWCQMIWYGMVQHRVSFLFFIGNCFFNINVLDEADLRFYIINFADFQLENSQ